MESFRWLFWKLSITYGFGLAEVAMIVFEAFDALRILLADLVDLVDRLDSLDHSRHRLQRINSLTRSSKRYWYPLAKVEAVASVSVDFRVVLESVALHELRSELLHFPRLDLMKPRTVKTFFGRIQISVLIKS